MCGSMVDIQSPTAEIRRGKKEERRKKEETTGWKYIWPALLHRAAINNGHYPLRRSKSFKDTDFGTNWKLIYDFLLVINTNVLLILTSYLAPFPRYSLRWIQNRYIWPTLLSLMPPPEGFPWDDLRKIFHECQWMARVSNDVETVPKISTGWVGCTSVTDRQTDGRQHIANNVR